MAEIICNRIGNSYFKVLEGLEGDTPNQVHLWLAMLAKIGKLKVIITTNFDTLIEKAFRIINSPLTICVDPKDYEQVPDLLNKSVNKETPCILLKLHGTANRPETCIDTLAQRKRGLDPKILKALNLIGSQTFWIFLGYSGADLEADPNYLGLRKRMNNSPGFAWLHLNNTEPLNSVSELAKLYGKDRGIIDFGILPNWLNDCKIILPDFMNPPNDLDVAPEQLNEIKEEKLKKVRNHSKSWAFERGELSSALILSDIGVEAGAYEAAKSVLVDLIKDKEEYQISSRNLAIIYLELGKISKHFGDNKEALSYYQKSSDLFKNVDDLEGYLTTVHEISRMQHHFGEFLKAENNRDSTHRMRRLYLKRKRQLTNYLNNILAHLFRNLQNYHVSTIILGDLKGIRNSQIPPHYRNKKKINKMIQNFWSYHLFLKKICYKCEEFGIKLITINEADTSSTCPICKEKVVPHDRAFRCPYCGYKQDRDVVGCINILDKHVHDHQIDDIRVENYPVVSKVLIES